MKLRVKFKVKTTVQTSKHTFIIQNLKFDSPITHNLVSREWNGGIYGVVPYVHNPHWKQASIPYLPNGNLTAWQRNTEYKTLDNTCFLSPQLQLMNLHPCSVSTSTTPILPLVACIKDSKPKISHSMFPELQRTTSTLHPLQYTHENITNLSAKLDTSKHQSAPVDLICNGSHPLIIRYPTQYVSVKTLFTSS